LPSEAASLHRGVPHGPRGTDRRDARRLPARRPLAERRATDGRSPGHRGASEARLSPGHGRGARPDRKETYPMSRNDPGLVPSPDVVARRVAGEYLLVPVRSGAAQMDFIFTANEVGSVIFQLLDGRRTPDEIARLVSLEFDVDEERSRADVTDFLKTLLEAGLVRPVDAQVQP